MFSLRKVPLTHPMDRKSKKANLAIIFFLLLGTILSQDSRLVLSIFSDIIYTN
jgi:hypothetical protein